GVEVFPRVLDERLVRRCLTSVSMRPKRSFARRDGLAIANTCSSFDQAIVRDVARTLKPPSHTVKKLASTNVSIPPSSASTLALLPWKRPVLERNMAMRSWGESEATAIRGSRVRRARKHVL